MHITMQYRYCNSESSENTVQVASVSTRGDNSLAPSVSNMCASMHVGTGVCMYVFTYMSLLPTAINNRLKLHVVTSHKP